jgi:hypothetical protein
MRAGFENRSALFEKEAGKKKEVDIYPRHVI